MKFANTVRLALRGFLLAIFHAATYLSLSSYAEAGSNLFVSDAANNSIHKFSATGTDLGTLAGNGMSGPEGVAFDRSGNLYVANSINSTISQFGPNGADLGVFTNAAIYPEGIDFDSSGNLYVATGVNGAHRITLISQPSPGIKVISQFASTGSNNAFGLTFDREGNLYAAYYADKSIHEFSPTGTDLGTFASTGLNGPVGLAFDSRGNLYTSCFGDTASIHKFGPTGDDLGTFASIGVDVLWGITFDSADNLYVADITDHSVHEFDSNGNDLGIFADIGMTSLPQFLAFAPSVVPEPSSAVLLLVGGSLVAIRQLRRPFSRV